ncbi:UNVERIFIED_ORG: hypothetical protein FHR35_009219 [Microbispora rosea subsp. rosea]
MSASPPTVALICARASTWQTQALAGPDGSVTVHSVNWADQQRCLRALRAYGWNVDASAGPAYELHVKGWSSPDLKRRIINLSHAQKRLLADVEQTAQQAVTDTENYLQAHPGSPIEAAIEAATQETSRRIKWLALLEEARQVPRHSDAPAIADDLQAIMDLEAEIGRLCTIHLRTTTTAVVVLWSNHSSDGSLPPGARHAVIAETLDRVRAATGVPVASHESAC